MRSRDSTAPRDECLPYVALSTHQPRRGQRTGPQSSEMVEMKYTLSLAWLEARPPRVLNHRQYSQVGIRYLDYDSNPTYLTLGVPVPVLVLVPQGKFQWIMILDFLIGHLLTDTLGRYHSHYISQSRPRRPILRWLGDCRQRRPFTEHFLGQGNSPRLELRLSGKSEPSQNIA